MAPQLGGEAFFNQRRTEAVARWRRDLRAADFTPSQCDALVAGLVVDVPGDENAAVGGRQRTVFRGVGGEFVEEFPGDIADLEGVVPRYEWFDGWMCSTAGARQLSDLPAAARAYLDRIEALVECPIKYVSVGTRRDQILETGIVGG